MCVLLQLPNKASILWPLRDKVLSEVVGSIMLWSRCSHFFLSQGIKYSLSAARKTAMKISLTWLKLLLSVKEHNDTLTSAVLKPFCLCVVAPVPWTIGFTHWEPQLFLFSVFSVPAVADAAVTAVCADFPSSRRPSRYTGNCAINTDEQFVSGSGFPQMCDSTSHGMCGIVLQWEQFTSFA